jgi:uncharacterized membrane protein YcaP (DUF421 family)
MSWGEITLRLAVTYFAMLIMARFMGKIQLSQLTFSIMLQASLSVPSPQQ